LAIDLADWFAFPLTGR